MKILRLNAYFPPEKTSGEHLINDLNSGFADHGLTCVLYTPSPTRGVSKEIREKYKARKVELINNDHIIVKRFAMMPEKKNPVQRALRYLCCNIAEYFKGISEKEINIVFSSSTPPTQGPLSAAVASRLSKKYGKKVPFVYNLQDVFPDSLVTTGMTHKGSLIWKIGRKIEDFTYRNADQIIVISESMKHNILEKGVPEDKITVVPNWIDIDAVGPVEKEHNSVYNEFSIDPQKFTVLYAGNFGAAQGADIVLKVAEALKEKQEIQFVIFGGGAEFAAAKEKASSLPNVLINELLPQNRISEVYSIGDVALITCKAGVGTSGMPSKTWSIMACNTPIIASFDMDSELNEILKDSGAGICTPAEDSEALKNAILNAFEEYQKNGKTQVMSREYVMEHATKSLCVSRYIEVLKKSYQQQK